MSDSSSSSVRSFVCEVRNGFIFNRESVSRFLEVHCFVGSVFVSGKWSWILGSVWDHPGSISGLWEEFLDERNFSRILESMLRYWEVFEILGNVLRFWEVFCDTGKCFTITGNCFGTLGRAVVKLMWGVRWGSQANDRKNSYMLVSLCHLFMQDIF